MDRKVLFVCLCVTVFSSLISISHGGFCSRIQHHYSYQRYCAYRSWWRGCVRYGYLPISVYDVVMGCCTGFEGSDCTTPICMTPCEPGYMCTSPDDCTVDPTSIGTTNAPINTNTAVNETTSATVEPSNSPSTEPNEIINQLMSLILLNEFGSIAHSSNSNNVKCNSQSLFCFLNTVRK